MDIALGAVHQVDGAMEGDHRGADHAAQQGKGIEQAPEAAGVVRHQIVVKMEGHALQQVAEGHAEDQRWHRAPHEQAPVPGAAPARVVDLAAIVEPHRPEEQCPQHGQHGPVETGEGRRIDQRPGGEDGAAAGDEPHLVAVPVRADGVDDDAALDVILADEGQQGAHAHVVAVHDGEADEQHTHQQPPDELESRVVDDHLNSSSLCVRGFIEIAAGAEAARSLAGKLHHQIHLDDEQQGVEADKAGQ